MLGREAYFHEAVRILPRIDPRLDTFKKWETELGLVGHMVPKRLY